MVYRALGEAAAHGKARMARAYDHGGGTHHIAQRDVKLSAP
jgi:hypothetical protein